MAKTLRVNIVGDATSLIRALKRSEMSMAGVGKVAGVAGLALGGALAVGLTKAAKGAMEDQVAQDRLAQAFKNSHVALGPLTDAIEKQEEKGRKLGFADEQLTESLGSLVTATHDGRKAIQLSNVAMDLARFKHTSLEAASKMLTSAMAGNVRAAKQLGIVIPTSITDPSEKARLVIEKVTGAVHGQAEAFSGTAQGKLDAYNARMDELQDNIGKAVLPALVKLTDKLTELTGFFAKHEKLTKTLIIGLGGLAAAMIATSVAAFILANALTLGIAAAVVVVIAGIVLLIKNFNQVKQFMLTWGPLFTAAVLGPFGVIALGIATNSFGIRTKIENTFTAIAAFVKDKMGDVAGFITNLPARIGNFGSRLGAVVTGFISDANIGERIRNFITTWAGFFGDIPQHVARAVAGKAQALWNAIKGIFDKLPGFIRDALGIKSPSKEFEAIGVAIMEGAIKGIKGLKDRLLEVAMDAFSQLPDAVRGAVGQVVGIGADASEKVQAMVATANAIDQKHYPYAWGGGHNMAFAPSRATDGAGTFGYDCSGAVSAVLHSAGLISSPMVSGELAGWGASGFGKFVTIFADAVHTFMTLVGHGWGTGGENARGGAGWLSYNTPYRSGFATRHPPGLAAGGYVAKTGFAVVHEGETFSGVGRSMGNTYVTVNMPNYLGNVRDAAEQIRQELTRNGIRQGGGILRGTA